MFPNFFLKAPLKIFEKQCLFFKQLTLNTLKIFFFTINSTISSIFFKATLNNT